jgi:hypothetical protein
MNMVRYQQYHQVCMDKVYAVRHFQTMTIFVLIIGKNHHKFLESQPSHPKTTIKIKEENKKAFFK